MHPIDVNDQTGSQPKLVERRARARGPEEARWYVIIAKRIWSLMTRSDTTPTQFNLALCALAIGVTLLTPGDTLTRPAYHYMADAAGNYADEKWAALWFLLAALYLWNVFTFGHPRTSLVINLFGATMFSVLPLAIFLELTEPVALIAPLSLAASLAAGWVAVCTQNKPPRGWRGD